ncbi:MAG: response regulator transcription factor, partial [Bacteroidetes bacterium]|nr:response regulator transcription factor [Bacteroidota bacterium]
MEAEAKNIVIAEDHDVFREGLKIVLSKMPQIKSVFGASNGVELLTILENKKIDIVLMDIEMPC